MEHWILITLCSIAIANHLAHGFLFTPKFQIFLNQIRENEPNHQFTTTWNLNNNVNNNGFSYTTNQFGE